MTPEAQGKPVAEMSLRGKVEKITLLCTVLCIIRGGNAPFLLLGLSYNYLYFLSRFLYSVYCNCFLIFDLILFCRLH